MGNLGALLAEIIPHEVQGQDGPFHVESVQHFVGTVVNLKLFAFL